MKKKLLFILPALYSGGAERSLITLLTLLTQTDRYELDLLLFRREGLFLPAVPAGVTVLDGGKKYAAFDGAVNGAVQYGLAHAAPGFVLDRFAYAKALKNGERKTIWRCLKKALPKLDKEYDAAIGYLEGNALYYCAECVDAKRKIGYVHNDYNKLGLSAEFDRPFVEKLDYFVTVSPECGGVLAQQFPEARDKIRVIENITSPAVLQKQAAETPPEFENGSGKILLTVGRLNPQKGYDLALEAAAKLKRDGAAYTWFCIGTGELKEALGTADENLEDDAAIEALDKSMKNRNWMKGSDAQQTAGTPKTHRNVDTMGRLILATEYMTSNTDYYIRFKQLLSDNKAEFLFDYIELVPKSVYDVDEDKH